MPVVLNKENCTCPHVKPESTCEGLSSQNTDIKRAREEDLHKLKFIMIETTKRCYIQMVGN